LFPVGGGDSVIEYNRVVDSDGSGVRWYRKWKSGWLEQGGQKYNNAYNETGGTTVSFLKPFADTTYTIVLTPSNTSVVWTYQASTASTKLTTTSFNIVSNSGAGSLCWYAAGYAS